MDEKKELKARKKLTTKRRKKQLDHGLSLLVFQARLQSL